MLGSCQEELLSSDGLEGAVEVIKISVPPFAEQNVEWLVKEALSLDVSKDLESYEVSDTFVLAMSLGTVSLRSPQLVDSRDVCLLTTK